MQSKKTSFCTWFYKNPSLLKKINTHWKETKEKKNTLASNFWQQNPEFRCLVSFFFICLFGWGVFCGFFFFLLLKSFYLSEDLLLRTIHSQMPEICLACGIVCNKLQLMLFVLKNGHLRWPWPPLCIQVQSWLCEVLDHTLVHIYLYLSVSIYKYLKGRYVVKCVCLFCCKFLVISLLSLQLSYSHLFPSSTTSLVLLNFFFTHLVTLLVGRILWILFLIAAPHFHFLILSF